ncbi:hypothetical protein [Saccharomonospora sp. NB11]|jgi:hypothetical protein|uniref:hypothetical protein n=1 Tax=Saccharomonospora sp. NB11 TaxID=1642298 RepID=UPI0018D06FFE|nr:hypothetical protein [Saccharomonospora sp. NB11]
MSELIEFEDLVQIETLLRAGMELKFEVSGDESILNESPIYASALNRLRDGLISGLRSNHLAGKAQAVGDWYQLSYHRNRWDAIARRAISHPHWGELDPVDLREWIETLAAPLSVDDETMAAIKASADEIVASWAGGGDSAGE